MSEGVADAKPVLFSQLLRIAHDAPRTITGVAFEPAQRVAIVTLADGNRLRAAYPREESRLDLEELLRRSDVPFEPVDG